MGIVQSATETINILCIQWLEQHTLPDLVYKLSTTSASHYHARSKAAEKLFKQETRQALRGVIYLENLHKKNRLCV